MFHHRFATSTIDIRNACHPFSTKDYFKYQYVGVHNGVVRNSRELRKTHEELGIKYVSIQENDTFNDSEALIFDLARYFEGEVDTLTATGSIAFIVVKRDKHGKPQQLFFGHNSGRSTLKMKKTDKSLTISSEGEGQDVPINQLHIFDYETKELRTRYMDIPSSSYSSGGSTVWPAGRGNHAGHQTPAKDTSNIPVTYNTGGTGLGTPFDSDYDDDYFDKRYNVPQRDEKQKLIEQIDKEWHMMAGDKSDIRAEFMRLNRGNYLGAGIAVQMEIFEAEEEYDLMNRWVSREKDTDTLAGIIDYGTEVKEYIDMLEDLSTEFFAKSEKKTDGVDSYQWDKDKQDLVKIKEPTKEDHGKPPFGFHAPADRFISPSQVLQNNNKQLTA